MSRHQAIERVEVQAGGLSLEEHLARYRLACQHVEPGPVLDIACGTGYGSDMLGAVCDDLVTGVDLDLRSVVGSRRAYPTPRLAFAVGSGTSLPFRAASFGTIVSMETLEHVREDCLFLGELVRVLRPAGVCIISATNRVYSEQHGIKYPYHVREYDEAELTALLSEFFGFVRVLYQGFADSYHLQVKGYAEAIQSEKQRLPQPMQLILRTFYRPLKRYVPVSTVNYFIRSMLGLRYPQPLAQEIAISAQPVQDCSTFVVICRQPNSNLGMTPQST